MDELNIGVQKCTKDRRIRSSRLRLTVNLFLTLLGFCSAIFSQGIRFKHLNINDGLSQNAVFAITQDKEGFMWFGTKDGLNKYDGYKFTVYQHDPNNQMSLDANYIKSLYCDKQGVLWVGTESGMLNRFDKKSNSFLRIKLPLADGSGDNHFEIKTINEDVSGNIWVGTRDNGLFQISVSAKNTDDYQVEQIHNVKDGLYPLSHNTIRDIYADEKGYLWIGTNVGLNRLNIETKEIKSFYLDVKKPEAPKSNSDLSITCIYGNNDGYLWLGTLTGLVKFDTSNFKYKVYPHHLSVFRYGWGEITEIIEDKDHDLWLATSAELMRFNPITEKYTSYKHDAYQDESLSFNSVSSLFLDRSHIIWIGTTGMGIDYYDPKAHHFLLLRTKNGENSRISSFSITSILEENDRYVWVSGEVLYRWDRETGKIQSFEGDSNEPYRFGNTAAWSMIKSKDGNLWFSSTTGIYKYDPKTGKSTNFRYSPDDPNGVPQKDVYLIYEDLEQNLWIVTENFLSKMIDRENGVFTHFRYLNGPEFNVYVRPVLLDEGIGKMWLGSKHGLLLFDKKTETFEALINQPENPNSLINNHVKSLCQDPIDPEKFLWIGTSGGLELYDKEQKTFSHFTEKDGLPNNVIYGILPDPPHHLWLSTNKGLSKFNLEEKRFRNFDVQDGLQSNEFNTGAYFRSEKGELFFGGINGLNYFIPGQIKNNAYIPPIAFTGLKVYSESSDTNKQNFFTDISLYDKNSLTFNNKDGIITFEFSALDFSSPKKNQYAYKLDKLHEDWIYINNQNTATFTNLPSGNYTFHVKGSNNDGVWNEAGISIPIKVLPHWSGTWWAYALYAILLFSLLSFIRNREMKRLAIKNQLGLERIESDSLRELDQLKSQFFTNISHEFRTPLTLIAGQTENLLEELQSTENVHKVQRISQNAKRIMQLINQIMDLAKLEAGKMNLYKEQENIVLYLKNLFFSFESIAEQKDINLIFISDENDIQVVFDLEKMDKIITNLISNAIKFTKDNGSIELNIKRHSKDRLTILLTDSGIGISEKDLPHIFDRFYQADNSETKKYEGTGIGLALTKELVELHGGTIVVHSNKKDGGTIFKIDLPIGEPKSDQVTIKFEDVERQNHVDSWEKMVRTETILTDRVQKIILLIEDNEDIRKFVAEQLMDTYEIVEAENGDQGIEEAQKLIPDLIITDVMMPKMDGHSLVKYLKNNEKTSHIPIVMLTGKATQEDKLSGLETGVDAYITKPFSIKELKIWIANLIRQHEQIREKYRNEFVIDPTEISVRTLDQDFLLNLQKLVLQNLNDATFGVEQLAEKTNLSTSQLHRKLHALIDQAPGQFIRNMRLQKASELIKQNKDSLADICFKTGFNDQAYFSRAFKNQFGCSPSAYKKDFN
ncbi:hybrid sensor histidine kinase/response regulator transcription factor [Namhaeicola litoreus]|uniref:histidine kinase n=1 Tax=Namhaeicola litoreus TaxID=1052145 RepID=A0ABW3Y130_9FLAO